MKYGELIARHNPSQNHWELNQLLLELERFEINTVLEIGMHQGGSLGVWYEAFDQPHVVGVNWGDELTRNRELVNPVFGRSQDLSTLKDVIETLAGSWVDFLFIDGGHLLHEVGDDWRLYTPLVREGGVVALHDVHITGNPTCEVDQFWAGLKLNNRTKTIWDGTAGAAGNGVGLVYL